ncbi:MAG TPA: hypothetical protein PK156_23855 [Polyangium sp.]|nr:hypothetical protein [Polyangium sp.]
MPPYGIELKVHGKAPGDVAFCPGDALVVSDRFRVAWETSQLRGLEFVPVERVRVRPARLGRKPLTYYHIEPPRLTTNTQIDVARSLIEYNQPITCQRCQSEGVDTIRGFSIDEASWSGEDMFYARGMPGPVIVTDRVRQLRDEFGLTNVNLTPTEKYVWDPLNKWTPVDYSRDEVPAPDEDDQQNTSKTN